MSDELKKAEDKLRKWIDGERNVFAEFDSMDEWQGYSDALSVLTKANAELRNIVNDFIDIDETPERNCSCHLSPPCNDCVSYGGAREVIAHAKSTLAKWGD